MSQTDTVKAETGSKRSADSAERAYKAIRKDLIEFKIRPEQRINEVQFAKSLELSRTPIREALNRLASEGFVLFQPNKGFFFRGLDIGDLLDLFEMRAIIEKAAFALLCARADDQGLWQLGAFWTEAKVRYGVGDRDEILDLDEAFHVSMAELSGNPEIVRQLRALNARIRFVRRMQIEHSPKDALLESHSALVDAALRRDCEGGMQLLQDHISLTVTQAQQVLKEALLTAFVTDKRATRDGRPLVDRF